MKDELRVHGLDVSHDTIWRFLCCEGISFKKDVLASAPRRPDIRRRHKR